MSRTETALNVTCRPETLAPALTLGLSASSLQLKEMAVTLKSLSVTLSESVSRNSPSEALYDPAMMAGGVVSGTNASATFADGWGAHGVPSSARTAPACAPMWLVMACLASGGLAAMLSTTLGARATAIVRLSGVDVIWPSRATCGDVPLLKGDRNQSAASKELGTTGWLKVTVAVSVTRSS